MQNKWKCYEKYYDYDKKEYGRRLIGDGVHTTTTQNSDVPFNVIYEIDYFSDQARKAKVELISENLTNALQKLFPEKLIRVKDPIDAKDLFLKIEMLKDTKKENPAIEISPEIPEMETLIEYIAREFEKTIEDKKRALKSKKIPFDLLWAFYTPNSEVFYQCSMSGENLCGTIASATEKSDTDTGMQRSKTSLVVNINVIDYDGTAKKRCTISRPIDYYSGEKNFSALSVSLSKFNENYDEIKKDIIRNGALFFKYSTSENLLMNYSGSLLRWKDIRAETLEKIYADGRVMIHHESFALMNPDYPMSNALPPRKYQRESNFRNNVYVKTEDEEDNYLFASATVYGFSFALKMWGQFEVIKFKPVKFDTNVIEYLVMSESKKKLLGALVNHYRPRDKTGNRSDSLDPIANKGNGLIILCHGPPGTGKTLTAESVAESLKRPLWVLGVHELGTDPARLEQKLSKVLEISYTWNAILLLDEADIYLERRSTSDINRNMLVGVFLRMLEYYRGILFLTTNRGSNFDDAICSRINLFLSYPSHDEDSRRKIWTSLIKRAKLSFELTEDLLKQELNGREIRNVLHIARMFAESSEQELTTELVIGIIEDYKNDLQELKANEKDDVEDDVDRRVCPKCKSISIANWVSQM